MFEEINYNTKLYGLIGKNIKYTLSPYIHNYSFKLLGVNAVYLVFDLDETKFNNAVIGLLEVAEGLNVTIPYKEKVISYLKRINNAYERIGAINTIFRGEGFNTDYMAIKVLVSEKFNSISGLTCQIFGAGGASKAVAFALGELGCFLKILNRTTEKAIELVNSLNKNGINAVVTKNCDNNNDLIVNATPNPSIVTDECVKNAKFVIELVYDPVETELVKKAKKYGLKYIDGIEILVRQAMESEKIWFNKSVPYEKIIEYLYARKLIRREI
ncbi:shikimate dehydrogenase [Sulfolobus sp. A20]|uniref:shikimate dehydrogenase family protein n=1 Tax=Saccharolobus sp. A20 TaxID=1891280 RepID=UPI000845D811|nr:shikimate dehydrogenase [Sulfolobus sp. A20]TRM76642.1 shikimate dehydrogenase [Sulfolobus sp. A20-N-F8]TRM79292.1 shikimate dehydrogenase [Sulfolobus sp. B5]TRM82150.1 shikimate dehydrogenase [Sulfolobus sp. D5]TRM84715.1 shikimate dehydrogenase [Sulfolobus sp. F3]TRM86981.1 shikimate dehydrogenase [Sulfolobus sp. E3]TRM87338.1 shikimate dehydrogenase [Sulfolobus sp. C3]TRM97685.1 shikimate dehydrogenase [Sulfolobus sp. E1]TRM99896.1 shikimate dehydrogenase [Sulfolobus sp. F1]